MTGKRRPMAGHVAGIETWSPATYLRRGRESRPSIVPWRAQCYGGPSSYLLVSRASRLHDRPVSAYCLQMNILGGVSVSSLRQTAIQNLIHGAGCDGLQLANYARLSLDAAGV